MHCFLCFSGKENVMGVSYCFRKEDHVVIVMPYMEHQAIVVSVCWCWFGMKPKKILVLQDLRKNVPQQCYLRRTQTQIHTLT